MKRTINYVLTFTFGSLFGLWIGNRSPITFDTSLKSAKPTIHQDLPVALSTPANARTPNPTISLQSTTENKEPRLAKRAAIRDDIYTQVEEFESYINQDDLDGGASVLQRMEAASKHSKQFLESKSRLLVRQRDWEEAKIVLKQCLEAYPRSKACLVDLSSTELQIGSKEDQEKAISACLSQAPKDPQCRNMLAILKMNQGKFGDAVSVYRQLISDNGSYGIRFDEGMLNWQLALALEGAGNLPDALSYFDKACRNNFEASCKKYEEVRAKL